MIPLRDNIPTERFPIVTVILIAINIAVFGWQLATPTDEYSSPELRALGVGKRDEQTIKYGAIPYRLTHAGKQCAVGPVADDSARRVFHQDVVCKGSDEYARAQRDAGVLRTEDPSLAATPFAPIAGVGAWLTILFAMFMHGGFLHIAGNMLFLWIFGNNVEDSMGRLKFVLFYLLAGLVAIWAQTLIAPDATVPTIGASGAVAGVLGAYILLHPRARVLSLVIIIFFVTLIEVPAMILLGIWFALQALPAFGQLSATGIGDAGGVAYMAHIGGFLFGLAAIKLFARRSPHPEPVTT